MQDCAQLLVRSVPNTSVSRAALCMLAEGNCVQLLPMQKQLVLLHNRDSFKEGRCFSEENWSCDSGSWVPP